MHNEIEHLLKKLYYKFALWEEEYNVHGKEHGDGRSRMKAKDLDFLKRQIHKVESIRSKLTKDLNNVRDLVQAYEDKW